MKKAQAISTFWNGFGLKSYDETSVPSTAVEPYITYEVITDSIDGQVSMSASLWYRSESWKDISDKAEEIAEYIAKMSAIKIDGGYLQISKGTSFAQRMAEPSDTAVRRIVLNIYAEYLTAF